MNDYEIIPNKDERCWDLYVGEDWYKSFGSREEAETEREKLEAEDEEASREENPVDRFLAADADYKAFVRTTRSYQLAIEGVRQ